MGREYSGSQDKEGDTGKEQGGITLGCWSMPVYNGSIFFYFRKDDSPQIPRPPHVGRPRGLYICK